MKKKETVAQRATPNFLLNADGISPKAMHLARQVQTLGFAAIDDEQMPAEDVLRALMGATLTVCSALMESGDMAIWMQQLSEELDDCKPTDSG